MGTSKEKFKWLKGFREELRALMERAEFGRNLIPAVDLSDDEYTDGVYELADMLEMYDKEIGKVIDYGN